MWSNDFHECGAINGHGNCGTYQGRHVYTGSSDEGLPFATYYRTSMLTYEVSKRLVNVTSVTMMNLLLNRPVIHEYIQGDATAKTWNWK
ncbi:MAG: hypothetical protein IPM83_16390 [Ignavibacteria bacterium]|nr:hypothetical protein [Ignavibacteria bacterium]